MKENTNAPIYTLTGIVIHGRGIGKHVGTPTANMEIAKNTFFLLSTLYHLSRLKYINNAALPGAVKENSYFSVRKYPFTLEI